MDQYVERTRDHITGSKLKEFMRCGFCFHKKFIEEIPEPQETFDKDYFIVGRAFDDLVTFGRDAFADKYAVVSRRNPKEDTPQLTQGMAKTIDSMYEAFKLNPFFKGEKQKETIYAEYKGIPLSGEFDDIDHEARCIIDVKTTASLATFDAESHLWQMAFYHLIYDLAKGEQYTVRLEVVDKTTPVAHNACFEFTLPALYEKKRDILRALDQYKEAQETGIFPTPHSWKSYLACPYYGVEGHGIQSEIYYL